MLRTQCLESCCLCRLPGQNFTMSLMVMWHFSVLSSMRLALFPSWGCLDKCRRVSWGGRDSGNRSRWKMWGDAWATRKRLWEHLGFRVLWLAKGWESEKEKSEGLGGGNNILQAAVVMCYVWGLRSLFAFPPNQLQKTVLCTWLRGQA